MNKKLIKSLYSSLALFVALSSVTVTYASDYIVNDNFNNMSLGSAPAGYQVSDAAIYTVDLKNDNNYSVFLADHSGQLKLNKQFAAQTEVVTVSVDFMQEQLGSGTTINLTDNQGTRAIRLETRDNGTTLNYLVNGTYTNLTTITPGKWINIKMEANVKTKTVNIFIDGILKASNVPFKYDIKEISYFQTLTPHDKVSGHYIDNLVISASKAPIAIPDGAESLVLTVAQDNTGDFKTVQEAINFITANKNLPATLYIKEGIYKEVIEISKQVSNLKIIGAGSKKTILTFDNYSGKEKENGGTYGTGGSASTFIKGNNISVEGVTFENSFVEQGNNNEQAVALSVTGDQVEFKNCRFIGNQDTLLLDGGRQYFIDSYIEGDVDFIFGRSTAYFDNCEIHSLNRKSSSNNGYVVAPRTSIDAAYGFVFNNCQLTAEEGIAANSVYLGRPWCPSGTSVDKASAVFMSCELGAHIKTEPWTSMSGVPASHGRFFEYANTGAGATINASRPQLTTDEAATFTINNVLNNWEPSFASIVSGPAEELPPIDDIPPVIETIYFTDVTSTDAYYEDIMFLANNGYVKGIGKDQFAPLQSMTRSQFATIMCNVLNLKPTSTTSSFIDVNEKAWYFESIQACYDAGLIKGVSATKFAPNEQITKQDMMVLLSRVINHLNIKTSNNDTTIDFIDAEAISGYAKEGILTCIQAGILKDEGYFIPKNIVTRADMATMFAKIIKLGTSK